MASETLNLILKATDAATVPLTRVQKKIKALTAPLQSLKAPLSNVGSESLALGTKLLAGFGIAAGGVAAFTAHFVKLGDDLATNADRVQLNVDAFASLAYAAEQADVEQAQFAKGMDYLNRGLGQAKAGTGAALKFLSKISPVLAKQFKSARTTEEGLSLITDAMAKIPDQSRQAALAMAIFGDSGMQMGRFLSQGSANIQKTQLEFMQLAGSQEAFAKAAGELDNALRPVKVALYGLGTTIAAELFPAFKEMADEVLKFILQNKDGLMKWAKDTSSAIRKWVQDGGIQRLIQNFTEFKNKISAFISFVGGWKTVLGAFIAILAGPLLISIGQLTIAIVTMEAAAWPVIGVMAAIALAIGGVLAAGYQLYKNWDDLTFIFKDWWSGGFVNSISEAWKTLKAFASYVGTLLDGPFGALINATTFGMAGWTKKALGSPSPSQGGALPRPASALQSSSTTQTNNAQVEVKFVGMPRGAQVSTQSTGAPVNYSVGYGMSGGI